MVKPLKGNANGCVDGAAEGDVIERVDDLGQEIGIASAVLCYWPVPDYAAGYLVILCSYTATVTSDKGVVEDHKDDEDTIKDGQGNEESVE